MIDHKWIFSFALSTLAVAFGVEVTKLLPGPIMFRELRSALSFQQENGASPRKHMVETMGSGAAFLDFDGDGWLDIYLVNGGTVVDRKITGHKGKLFRNVNGQKFDDVTESSGIRTPDSYGMGVAVGDYDGDGRDDLYLTGYPRSYLFRNLGHGKFEDVTVAAMAGVNGWSTSAAFLDYDGDGQLDLYIGRYVRYEPALEPYCGIKKEGWRSYCLPDVFEGASGVLLRNNGHGGFADVSRAAGLDLKEAKTLGVSVGDYDHDGKPDLFVANDRVRNFLFRNLGNGKFEERGERDGVAYSDDGTARAGMGSDMADYDNDGHPDILVTNFETEGAALFRNQGNGTFQDVAMRSELGRGSYRVVGFGAKLVDLDNDGFRDIFLVNGHVIDNIQLYKDSIAYRQPKLIFRNTEGRGFALQQMVGVSRPMVGRGAAFGDFDNDGRVDVLVNNNGGQAELLHNESSPKNHWIGLRLKGRTGSREGVGARVELQAGAVRQMREVSGAGSYLSANDQRVVFGIAQQTNVDQILIEWPSGRKQTILRPVVNRYHEVQEPEIAR